MAIQGIINNRTNTIQQKRASIEKQNTNFTALKANTLTRSKLNFLGTKVPPQYISYGSKPPVRKATGIYPDYNLTLNPAKTIPTEVQTAIHAEASKRIQAKPQWKAPIMNPNVWMVTSETRTFMKTGGLGDVAVDLPEAFNNKYNQGASSPKMTIVQPMYESGDLVKLTDNNDGTFTYANNNLKNEITVKDTGERVQVNVGNGKTEEVSVYKGTLKGTEYRFLRNKNFFGEIPNDGQKVSPYVENESGVGESERFAFLSKAVAEYVKDLKTSDSADAPDVIDANDWHAGPLAAQFRYLMPAKAANNDGISKDVADQLKDIPIVYTVHNLEYQGWDYPNSSKILNLLYEDYSDAIFKKAYCPKMEETPKSLIVRDTYNAAIHGLSLADSVVAVSPNYAKEIASNKFYGYDFVDVLKERDKSGNLTGIVNGIGQAGISPDSSLGGLAKKVYAKFPEFPDYNRDMSLSEVTKIRSEIKNTFINMIKDGTFEERLGLKTTDGEHFQNIDTSTLDKTPLLTVVSRLEGQKGPDMMAKSIKKAMADAKKNGQPLPLVVILGTGGGAEELNKMKEKLPAELNERVVFYNAFSADLMHLIQTAGDMFLMPSKFEPCGLGQLQAMAKGNVPVATATGGLANTIENGKTGFLSKYNPDKLGASQRAFDNALTKALDMYNNKREKFDEVAYAALTKDFSWDACGSLDNYLRLFQTGNIKGDMDLQEAKKPVA